LPYAEAGDLESVKAGASVAEYLCWCGHVKQDDRRKRQGDDSMENRHQKNYSWC